MNPALILLLAAGATWVLRISLITLLPASSLPVPLRSALSDVGPAVLAALVITHLTHGQGVGGFTLPDVLAAGVAAVVAWRTGKLSVTVIAGVAAAGVLRLVF